MQRITWKDSLGVVKNWPRWKRYAFVALASPTLLVSLGSLAFYANLHRAASAMSVDSFPHYPLPAPHNA